MSNGLCYPPPELELPTPYFVFGCADPDWRDGTCLDTCLRSTYSSITLQTINREAGQLTFELQFPLAVTVLPIAAAATTAAMGSKGVRATTRMLLLSSVYQSQEL
jgi:hypothetical protein